MKDPLWMIVGSLLNKNQFCVYSFKRLRKYPWASNSKVYSIHKVKYSFCDESLKHHQLVSKINDTEPLFIKHTDNNLTVEGRLEIDPHKMAVREKGCKHMAQIIQRSTCVENGREKPAMKTVNASKHSDANVNGTVVTHN